METVKYIILEFLGILLSILKKISLLYYSLIGWLIRLIFPNVPNAVVAYVSLITGVGFILLFFVELSLYKPTKGDKYEKKIAELIQSYFGVTPHRNILLTDSNGYTTEVDIAFCTKKGFIAIECKYRDAMAVIGNMSGGAWTVKRYDGASAMMNSPFVQNSNHLVKLKGHLGSSNIFNVVCLSAPFNINSYGNKIDSKKTPCLDMLNHMQFLLVSDSGWGRGIKAMKAAFDNMPDVFTDSEVIANNKALDQYNATKAELMAHAYRVGSAHGNM